MYIVSRKILPRYVNASTSVRMYCTVTLKRYENVMTPCFDCLGILPSCVITFILQSLILIICTYIHILPNTQTFSHLRVTIFKILFRNLWDSQTVFCRSIDIAVLNLLDLCDKLITRWHINMYWMSSFYDGMAVYALSEWNNDRQNQGNQMIFAKKRSKRLPNRLFGKTV
jgi:hypothetical protein